MSDFEAKYIERALEEAEREHPTSGEAVSNAVSIIRLYLA
jgi:hypothetical protein